MIQSSLRPIKPTTGLEKIPFQFDRETLEELQKFVLSFSEEEWNKWKLRQNTFIQHKETKTIPLKWLEGDSSYYHPNHTKTFPLYNQLNKIFFNFFNFLESHYDGKICRIIMTRQEPNSTIPPHNDINFTHTYTHRIHVPLITNAFVFFQCGEDCVNMTAGFVYEINNQLFHSVTNNSNEYKIHLIVDVIENKHIGIDPFPKNYLFIHIPKTAGTSITHALNIKQQDSWIRNPYFKNHDPYFVLEENNYIPSETFVFSVVRNPFTRAYSYYNHFKRINGAKITFNEFLRAVRSREKVSELTPLTMYNQSFFLFKNNGTLATRKIYNFERLQELEFDFGIYLNKDNVGSYSLENFYHDYGKSEQNLVRHIYAEDFFNFNYSFDFQQFY